MRFRRLWSLAFTVLTCLPLSLTAQGGPELSIDDQELEEERIRTRMEHGDSHASGMTELRTAANIMHARAGFGTIPAYTDPTIVPGSTVAKAVHSQEVEDVLRQARNTLGLSVPAPLGIAPGGLIRASHVIAFRSYAD